jgi:hypothetical protein
MERSKEVMMLKRALMMPALWAATGLLALAPGTKLTAQMSSAGVIVHEWGTFTTVAGRNGFAVEWLPLTGASDLPCFVYHYQNDPFVKLSAGTRRLDYDEARSNLWGRVRMETPVLYFYAPHDVSVNVRVQFRRGLMTEWYPHAAVTQSVVSPHVLRDPGHSSTIEWRDVRILPAATPSFLRESGESHYYAARATDASPLSVNTENEKFLFYRGVADFDVPLSAEIQGSSIRIANLGSAALEGVLLFGNRGGRVGYRRLGTLEGAITTELPALEAGFADLRSELESMLVGAGLYAAEAAAMVETWKDSWFEEGTRVFYLVPERAIESILPLAVTPTPASITRVFVGRMDVVTPAEEQAVSRAVARNDTPGLERFGRRLGPISDRLLAKSTDPADTDRIRAVLNAALARYVNSSRTCE